MKYIVCEKPGSFRMKEKAVPQYGEKEVLLQIKTVGICGTDLHAYGGNQPFFAYPRILGHELGAVIIEKGRAVKKFEKGDKVLIMPYLSCGKCIACRNEKTNCCTNIQVLGVHIDGGMQEKITVPEDILLEVNALSFEEIALVEPLAIGAHALRRAALKQGEFVVVVGCGPIGLGIMKQAQIAGGKVIGIDVVDSRLQVAKETFGIDYVIDAKKNPLKEVEEITGGDLAPIVIDATGNQKALEAGIQYMAHGGKYVLVGLFKGNLSFHHPSIHAKETSLLCSRNATVEDFQRVINLLKTGEFPTESFITHKVSKNEMIDHFDIWLDPATGVIKAMVEF